MTIRQLDPAYRRKLQLFCTLRWLRARKLAYSARWFAAVEALAALLPA